MARYFIHLAYNGACYHGWQTQRVATEVERTAPLQPGLPTVQQTLEDALSMLLRQPIAVVGCGRTDTGVHASDFYAHFNADGNLMGGCGELAFKLNSFLPQDIAIFDIFPVSDNAHARFDATARTYQYHVSDRRLPFRQGQYCRIYFRPDIDKMNEAAKVLMEYDDFTSFAKLHTQVKTNICHLTEAHWDFVPVKSYELRVKSFFSHRFNYRSQHADYFITRNQQFRRLLGIDIVGSCQQFKPIARFLSLL